MKTIREKSWNEKADHYPSKKLRNKNEVRISGIIKEEFEFHHQVNGFKFYKTEVEILGKSEITDDIPVIIPEYLLPEEPVKNEYAIIDGEYRSYNRKDPKNGCIHVDLFVYIRNILIHHSKYPIYDQNFIELQGYICKKPNHRVTYTGIRICDLMIAVNNKNRSYYIPCVAWNDDADYASQLAVGDAVQVSGKIKKRKYKKMLENGTYEEREAYEVSITRGIYNIP